MDGDCRVKMDIIAPTEPQEGHKSALKTLAACPTPWRCVVAALCIAAVLCVTLHFKEQGHTVKDDGLPLKLRAISKNARAAIHLEGVYNKELNTSVQWKIDVDQYHSEGDLKLEDNEIVIPQQGLYFVYSQASFRVSCQADQDDQSGRRQMVHLSYMVKRWSDSYSTTTEDYEIILHSVRTACEKTAPTGGDARDPGKWFNAVYMGAVFHLDAGDRLKTVIDKKILPNVNTDPGHTFFGVFAL